MYGMIVVCSCVLIMGVAFSMDFSQCRIAGWSHPPMRVVRRKTQGRLGSAAVFGHVESGVVIREIDDAICGHRYVCGLGHERTVWSRVHQARRRGWD